MTGKIQRGLVKILSSTGISEGSGEKCSHPHTEISEGSREKCTHPQEFQRGMEKNALIHIQEFQRGLEKNALIHRNFRREWRKMLSSTGVSEGSKKNSFKKGFNTNHPIHRGWGVHIKWNAPRLF